MKSHFGAKLQKKTIVTQMNESTISKKFGDQEFTDSFWLSQCSKL